MSSDRKITYHTSTDINLGCCYEAIVEDSNGNTLAECFDMAVAEKIAAALNAYEVEGEA